MKISIITVNYNDKLGLERTIRSVVALSYANKEFVVVDGASNDGSVDVIRKYEKYVSKWISEPDSGIYNAMNKGIGLATGDYCIFMNSGDVFYSPNVLNSAEMYLKSGADIYNGNAIYVKNGNIIEWYRKCQKKVDFVFLFKSSICHQATFIKTALLAKVKYDEKLKMVSDWKFWVEAFHNENAKYKAMNVDICCFDTGGVTTTRHEQGLLERRRVLEEVFMYEELEMLERSAKKNNPLKYIQEGLNFHFWRLYARLFMQKRVRALFNE